MSNAPQESLATTEMREVATFLLKSKWIILGVAVFVVAAGVLWTLQQPKVYEATCSIQYDPTPPRPLGNDVDDVTQPMSNFWLTREFYKTQNRIIASRMMAEKVVKKLGLNKDPDFMEVPAGERSDWKGARVEQAAQTLRRRLKIEQIKETRIVLLHVQDTSPQRAALLANTIADTYIDKTVEDRLGSTVNALEWLSEQLDSLREQLDTSELKLHEFKMKHNVLAVSMEDRQNIVANQIQAYTEALTASRTRRVEVSAKLEQLKVARKAGPLDGSRGVMDDDPEVAMLQAKYREKLAERAALASRYGEAHPKWKAIEGEIAALERHLNSAIAGVVRAAESELREVRAIETGLVAELDEANQAGLALNLQEIDYKRLNHDRQNKAKLHAILLERTAEANLSKLLRLTLVRKIDPALAPRIAVKPNLKLSLLLSLMGGLALGIGVAFARGLIDRTVKGPEEVEAFGLAVLGVVPGIEQGGAGPNLRKGSKRKPKPVEKDQRHRDLVVHHEPRSSVAECIRSVRTNLTFMGADRSLDTLVVTSPGPREGKTTVSVSLSISMAQSGKRVLLIDTDMRRPRLHRVFGLRQDVGITSILVGGRPLAECVQDSGVPGLSVLTCGPIPPNPAELLHMARFGELVEDAHREFDRVIFDSPPLGAVTDAAVVAPQVDGAILVVQVRKTTRDAALSAVRQLRDVGAVMPGAVLNRVDTSRGRYGYGGYYQYYRDPNYEYSSNDEPAQAPDSLPGRLNA